MFYLITAIWFLICAVFLLGYLIEVLRCEYLRSENSTISFISEFGVLAFFVVMCIWSIVIWAS